MDSRLSFKSNLDDIYVCKEHLLCIDYFIVESLTTVDASYFVMNFQSCAVNAFIINVSLDNDVCKQVIRVFCRAYCNGNIYILYCTHAEALLSCSLNKLTSVCQHQPIVIGHL